MKRPHDTQTTRRDGKRDGADLAAQLETARTRIKELEGKLEHLENDGERPGRVNQREALDADIECIGYFDVVQARGIDLSSGGICFEITQPMLFDMRFELQGQNHSCRGHLVWVRPATDGAYRLGFKFVEPESATDF